MVATTQHYLMAALLGLAVPILAYGLGWLFCRLRPGERKAVSTQPYPYGGPTRILLMRHAEKTGDLEDIHLSEPGVKRAEQLAIYIPETFGKPDFVFAAARSRRSIRSIETVTPLAAAVGTSVRYHVEDKDFRGLIREIFSYPDYHGKTIVICWHHGKLPEIAALLGGPGGSYPDPWPNDVFNLIVDFRYDPRTGVPSAVTQVVEPF